MMFSSFPASLVDKRVVDKTNEIDRGGLVYLMPFLFVKINTSGIGKLWVFKVLSIHSKLFTADSSTVTYMKQPNFSD